MSANERDENPEGSEDKTSDNFSAGPDETYSSAFQRASENINRPKTSRGRETYQNLLEAAEKIFGQKNYYDTTITEITREAGVAPGTFYIYFPNKKTIFRALILELNKKLRNVLAEAISGLDTRSAMEREGFKAFFSFINDHSALYKIVWQAQFVEPEIFREYYHDFAQSYRHRLARAVKRGEFKDLDPEVMAYCLIGISNFVGLRWIIWSENEEIPEDVIEDVMEFIFAGIRKD